MLCLPRACGAASTIRWKFADEIPYTVPCQPAGLGCAHRDQSLIDGRKYWMFLPSTTQNLPWGRDEVILDLAFIANVTFKSCARSHVSSLVWLQIKPSFCYFNIEPFQILYLSRIRALNDTIYAQNWCFLYGQ